MTSDPVIIGTRGSQLALIQAGTVMSRLAAAFPARRFEIKKIVTGGDRNQAVRLESLGGIGVFVKELEEALLAGTIDIAVHSLKDVPTLVPDGTTLTAVLEREDPRDVLVTRGATLDELPAGARLGTGSQRRRIQVHALRPDLATGDIRGNVDTRLRKVAEGEYDGIILAAAALHRMDMKDRITQYLPPEFLPAVGQGIVAMEIRSDDADAAALAAGINHEATWRCARAERAFLYELGGGCTAPIAARATLDGASLHIEGMAASEDGSRALRDRRSGPSSAPEAVGITLARGFLAQGAADFIERLVS